MHHHGHIIKHTPHGEHVVFCDLAEVRHAKTEQTRTESAAKIADGLA